MAYESENTVYGSYGEFEPIPFEDDNATAWAEHDTQVASEVAAWEAEAMADFYDYEPSPYYGDYSEM